jgi:hypothetical protein
VEQVAAKQPDTLNLIADKFNMNSHLPTQLRLAYVEASSAINIPLINTGI